MKFKLENTIDDLYKIAGFTLNKARKDENVDVLVEAFIDSNQPEFYTFIEHISNLYFYQKTINGEEFVIFPDYISNFLILIHDNNTIDILINESVQMQLKAIARNIVNKNQVITKKDIYDITEISFLDLEIYNKDKIIFCFKKGWKFGLYFNFQKDLDLPELYKKFAVYYKKLDFEEIYKIVENKTNLEKLIKEGWFPFIELMGDDFITLNQIYLETDSSWKNDMLIKFFDKFDKERIKKITDRWWNKTIFKEKKEILDAGIESYFQENKSGYINAIKNFYSEIEGIMVKQYFHEKGKKPNHVQTLDYIDQKAKKIFPYTKLS